MIWGDSLLSERGLSKYDLNPKERCLGLKVVLEACCMLSRLLDSSRRMVEPRGRSPEGL